jgi:hypothetical protein
MGENKQNTGPKSAAEHATDRQNRKNKHRPVRRRVQAAPLPTKPVFAPKREAELREVFRLARDSFTAWAIELVQGEPRLYNTAIKLGNGVLKYYVGFEYDMPKTKLDSWVMKKINKAFFDACIQTGIEGMRGQNNDWYVKLLVEVEKAAAVSKLVRKQLTPAMPPQGLQLLEAAFAEGEDVFRTWATQLVARANSTSMQQRLSEGTIEKALEDLRFDLGLRKVRPSWHLSDSILTELHTVFRKLCKRHSLKNTPGQNQNWYHELVRVELGYAGV